MKQFQSTKVNKVITRNREFIPKKLKEVLFTKKDGILLFDFYDMDKISISNEMMGIAFNDTTLYNYITGELSKLILQDNIIEDTEYIFNVGWKYRNVNNFLDRSKFFDVRHEAKLSILDLSHRIDISRDSIYLIEGGEVKNVRSDMLLKYCFFFKKPISFFLRAEFKDKMSVIDANTVMDSGSISAEQKETILNHFLK
jgi:DNA-binding Xre family transcriptional regulator